MPGKSRIKMIAASPSGASQVCVPQMEPYNCVLVGQKSKQATLICLYTVADPFKCSVLT